MRFLPLFLALPLLLCACKKEEVVVYRVPKEPMPTLPAAPAMPPAMPPAIQPSPMMPDGQPATANATPPVPASAVKGRHPTWTVPAGWEAKPVTGMRDAAFAVPGAEHATAEATVVVLDGDAGGALANLNRWRGQLSLPPATTADLPAVSQAVTTAAGPATMVELANPQAPAATNAMLAASLSIDGRTWFVKLSGPSAVVAAAKPQFLAFLQSFSVEGVPAP